MIVLRRLGRFLAVVVLGGVGLGACLAALLPAFGTFADASHYSGKIAGHLRPLPERTVVYDADGNVLDVLGLQDRQPVQLSEVPRVLIDAVVATEDRTFWRNVGVDPPSIARAFWANVGSGEVEQGGSTITQQLIKNRYFQNPKRDLDRKIREFVLAVRLTNEWSKRRILQEYLNTVYFGQGSYGVKSAAERFFQGTTLQKVDLAQAALLAGVIGDPENYNPFDHPEAARRRRTVVLERMVHQHYITEPQAKFAAAAPLPTVKPPAELRADNYYVNEVQRRLLADPRLGSTPTERSNKIFLGGLKIYTAFDPRMQLLAQNAVTTTLPVSPFTAAMAVMDPTNGEVKAMVAGIGFDKSQYNLATMPGPGRQPGSTMKAITLTTAIANGYSPKDSVDGTSPCTLKGKQWGPSAKTTNAEGGGGIMSLRSATENSVNCAYFRLGAGVGVQKVLDMAKAMGVSHVSATDGNGQPYWKANAPINVIGSGAGASPLDMATAFSTLAADGVRHDPVFVTRVEDAKGHVLFTAKTDGERVVDPQVARTVTDILRGVVTKGTGTRARIPFREVAGKTGTTDEKKNAWFAGYTPQLVAAVWMGDPLCQSVVNGQKTCLPMRSVGSVGAVYGGTYPAMIWQKFMAAALAPLPPASFIPPDKDLWPAGKYVSEAGRVRLAFPSTPSTRKPAPSTTTTTTAPAPAVGAPPP
jgi:penicillin-binding protein 1A